MVNQIPALEPLSYLTWRSTPLEGIQSTSVSSSVSPGPSAVYPVGRDVTSPGTILIADSYLIK